ALANAANADVIVAVVGELAYAEGVGDNPAPALPLTQIEIPRRLQKSNGACTPWMCPPVPNQINCSRSPVRHCRRTSRSTNPTRLAGSASNQEKNFVLAAGHPRRSAARGSAAPSYLECSPVQ